MVQNNENRDGVRSMLLMASLFAAVVGMPYAIWNLDGNVEKSRDVFLVAKEAIGYIIFLPISTIVVTILTNVKLLPKERKMSRRRLIQCCLVAVVLVFTVSEIMFWMMHHPSHVYAALQTIEYEIGANGPP